MKKSIYLALFGLGLNGHVHAEAKAVPGEASKIECSNGHKFFQVPTGEPSSNESLWISAWIDGAGHLDSEDATTSQAFWSETENQTWESTTFFTDKNWLMMEAQCQTKGRGCTYKFSTSSSDPRGDLIEIWKDVTCTDSPYAPKSVSYDVELTGEFNMKIDAIGWDFEGLPHLDLGYFPIEETPESWSGMNLQVSGVNRFGEHLVFLATAVKNSGYCDKDTCASGLEQWGDWKFHVTETSDGSFAGDYYYEGTPTVSAGKIVMKAR